MPQGPAAAADAADLEVAELTRKLQQAELLLDAALRAVGDTSRKDLIHHVQEGKLLKIATAVRFTSMRCTNMDFHASCMSSRMLQGGARSVQCHGAVQHRSSASGT